MMKKRNSLNLINKKIMSREAPLQVKSMKELGNTRFFISEQCKAFNEVQECWLQLLTG